MREIQRNLTILGVNFGGNLRGENCNAYFFPPATAGSRAGCPQIASLAHVRTFLVRAVLTCGAGARSTSAESWPNCRRVRLRRADLAETPKRAEGAAKNSWRRQNGWTPPLNAGNNPREALGLLETRVSHVWKLPPLFTEDFWWGQIKWVYNECQSVRWPGVNFSTIFTEYEWNPLWKPKSTTGAPKAAKCTANSGVHNVNPPNFKPAGLCASVLAMFFHQSL